jgi:hypothetical protein
MVVFRVLTREFRWELLASGVVLLVQSYIQKIMGTPLLALLVFLMSLSLLHLSLFVGFKAVDQPEEEDAPRSPDLYPSAFFSFFRKECLIFSCILIVAAVRVLPVFNIFSLVLFFPGLTLLIRSVTAGIEARSVFGRITRRLNGTKRLERFKGSPLHAEALFSSLVLALRYELSLFALVFLASAVGGLLYKNKPLDVLMGISASLLFVLVVYRLRKAYVWRSGDKESTVQPTRPAAMLASDVGTLLRPEAFAVLILFAGFVWHLGMAILTILPLFMAVVLARRVFLHPRPE